MFAQDSIGGFIIAEERFMQVTLRSMVTAYSEEHDLKAIHIYVLGMLSSERGQTMKQLKEKVQMTASNLSPVCSLLEKRELIRRERDDADGRSSQLFLTEQGKKMLDDLDVWLNRVLSCAGSDNAKLHDDIRRGFEAYRTLIKTAREKGERE